MSLYLPVLYFPSDLSLGQVATDGSVGAAQVLSGPDYEIGAELGAQAGGNLFHSFQQFSVDTGESATFSGPGSIDNIISRVTGGELSAVDGLIASTIPGASLWLFNPAGVVFGPNASLDVSGSFHVSSADEVRTADGGRFSAVDLDGNGFSVAAPESFGFLGADPAAVVVNGSQLAVDEGETLSIVGGDVDIESGVLVTGGGELNVLAAGGPADANVVTGELTGAADGDIDVTSSTLASIGDGGGSVRIQGGAFVVDQSVLRSSNTGSADSDVGIDVDVEAAELTGGSRLTSDSNAGGQGGSIEVAADDLSISGGSGAQSLALASGRGGDIVLAGGDIQLSESGFVASDVRADGDGGNLSLTADDVSLNGGIVTTQTSEISTGRGGDIAVDARSIELVSNGAGQVNLIANGTFGSGDAGDIDIVAPRVLLDGGNQLTGATLGSLPEDENVRGGSVRIVAGSLDVLRGGFIIAAANSDPSGGPNLDVTADQITIDNVGSTDSVTGIFLEALGNDGTSGSILIQASDIVLRDGGQVSSDTGSENDAGDIVILADSVSLSGGGDFGSIAQISSTSITGPTGDAGNITIVADDIDLSGGSRITGSALGEGEAGAIDITVRNSLRVRDEASIDTNAGVEATGDAGSIIVDATELVLLDGGDISSVTAGSSNAGTIDITAEKAQFDGRNGLTFGGITTQALPGSTGNAGDITLDVDDLTLLNTAQVSSSSFGSAGSGAISIRSGRIVIDSGDGSNGVALTGVTTATNVESAGDAGTITIVADDLVLSGDDAEIQSSNDGSGLAGAVSIQLTNGLVLADGADIFTDTASAGGGGVRISAGNFVVASGTDSVITTTVADDAGDAGDIVITTPLLAIGESRILARADEGQGGDIEISVDDLVQSPVAEINAEAGATGVDGTVVVSAPEVDLTAGLTALDGRFLDVSSLLRERCAARRADAASSFTLGTGGAVLSDLDAPRLSFLRTEYDEGRADVGDRRTVLVLPCPKTAS